MLQLFNHVYMEFGFKLSTAALQEYDCAILTDEQDFSQKGINAFISWKAQSIAQLHASAFPASRNFWLDFFSSIALYMSDRPFVIFVSKTDFALVMLQYYRDIYPAVTFKQLDHMYTETMNKVNHGSSDPDLLSKTVLSTGGILTQIIEHQVRHHESIPEKLRALLPADIVKPS